MHKLKVLHLITHLGFGGASNNTLLTVAELPRSRYEVHLAAGADYLDWVERGKQVSDAFFLFPDLCRSPKAGADARLLGQLTRFMQEQRYDIVHTHNAKAGIIGRPAAKLAGVPIILHTYHLLSWHDGMQANPNSRRKRLENALRSQFYFGLEWMAARATDIIVTVCEPNRQEAIARKLAPPDRIVNVYSGVELDRFQMELDRRAKKQSLGLDAQHPVVGMIGRLSAQKAPLDFVAAARQVLQDRPDAQFIMIGDGPLLAEVTAALADEPRIRLLGYRDDVPEILQILDVFALSSLWEGLGRALTEAMVAGAPVAATNVNGIPELVAHGRTGLLSPPADPAALAANIRWLLDNPEDARRMSEAARERVLTDFDSEKMIDQIAGLYERLCAQKLAPSFVGAPGVQTR
jgi:glycosyltransferase involved in cell wall biosynthesis